jgi:hypothetical protein
LTYLCLYITWHIERYSWQEIVVLRGIDVVVVAVVVIVTVVVV